MQTVLSDPHNINRILKTQSTVKSNVLDLFHVNRPVFQVSDRTRTSRRKQMSFQGKLKIESGLSYLLTKLSRLYTIV